MPQVEFNCRPLSLLELFALGHADTEICLAAEFYAQIERSRTTLECMLKKEGARYYGINTGFGALYTTEIADEDSIKLQENLVKSHACGTGMPVDERVVRCMLGLKILSFGWGLSGIRREVVDRLLEFYKLGILPEVPESGSLGASGDLAPLAHLSLPLLGMGFFHFQGKRHSGAEIESMFGLTPLQLREKEGLALLNGTQYMLAQGLVALEGALKAWDWAQINAAAGLDAYSGNLAAFDLRVHAARPHRGQIRSAEGVLALLKNSELQSKERKYLQDPYSFRCVPQVHGAILDSLHFIGNTIEVEAQSTTDNPLIFSDTEEIISGGNFHGEPLALAMDYLKIAVAELGSISERRIYKLINGDRGLPAFLTPNAGLNSGFMIVQYSAAALVSQNKQGASPASVDSIDSSRGQEDHVSMGANAALQARAQVERVWRILGMEWLAVCQALDFHLPLRSSTGIEFYRTQFRAEVPFLQEDAEMSPLIEKSIAFIQSHG